MTSRKSTQDLIIPIVQDGDVSSKKEKKVANDSVPCLFLDLKDWSRSWQFVILSASVFFFYLVRFFFQIWQKKIGSNNFFTLFILQLYGVTMEKIFRIPSLKTEGLYLTLVQFIFYTVFAKADMIRLKEFRHIPISTYFILAAATMTTMGTLYLFE